MALSDVEILDVVLAAAVRSFVSKTLDALCVEPDSVFAELEPDLRETLTKMTRMQLNRTLAA